MTTHARIPWAGPLAAAITVIAGTLVALTPPLASATPVSGPTRGPVATAGTVLCPTPPRSTTGCRDAALAYFIAAYRTAPMWDKRRIHNEITTILGDHDITCG